jgi:hypothetical protein
LIEIHLPAPDYSKSVRQVYLEAAAASIGHDNSLMLLSSLTGESIVPGLPSWVPDWSIKDFITEVALWNEERATGSSLPEFSISMDHHSLTLRGTIIATVEDVSSEYPQYSHLQGLVDKYPRPVTEERECRVLECWFRTFGNGADMVKFMSAFAYKAWKKALNYSAMDYIEYSTLVACWTQAFRSGFVRQSAEIDLRRIALRKARNKTMIFKGSLGDLEKDLVPFHMVVRKILDRKVMIRTRKGKLGVGCRSLQKGDRIALFAGCNLPMIIRGADQNWRFVSPAYLEGAMVQGPDWWSKQSPLQSFIFM